jgi:PHD/YefM family antitoxin component YafN of YafNO toxin-antitoxin module
MIMIGKEENIMCARRERAHQIIDSLSDTKIGEVLDYLEYIRIREELEATQEILDNKKLMESIEKGLAQFRAGEVISLDELKNA